MVAKKMQELLIEMDYANDQDCQAIAEAADSKSSRAMHRFLLLPKLNESLLIKANQDEFLKSHGLSILEKWLHENPDGSFPPYQVIECVMDVLERLPI